jgi:competence protein ComEC
LLILLVAAVTTAWNPLYVWGDIGWYLSFAAFFGVLVLYPLIVQRLYKSGCQPHSLTAVLLESLCAQVMTIPVVLYVFNQMSLVALPSNALIVPLVPLGMLLTFVAGMIGMVASPMAGWLAWPARILLTYMLDAINLFARIPHASIKRSVSVVCMLYGYIIIVVVCGIMWHKNRQKYAIVTEIETE